MDYLTWLTLLQEPDSNQLLPELLAQTKISKKSGGAEASEVSALAAVWEQASLACRRLERTTKSDAAPDSAPAAGQSSAMPGFYEKVGRVHFPEGFPESYESDMEAISRFFERDARRF